MGSKEELLLVAKIGAKDERLPYFCGLKISNYPLVHIKAKMMTLWRFVEYATVKNLTKKEKLFLSILGISTPSRDRSQRFNVKPLIAKSDAKGVHNDVCCAEKREKKKLTMLNIRVLMERCLFVAVI
jgi:hypothetical protein